MLHNASGYAMFGRCKIAHQGTPAKYGRALAISVKISNGAKANRIARVMCTFVDMPEGGETYKNRKTISSISIHGVSKQECC